MSHGHSSHGSDMDMEDMDMDQFCMGSGTVMNMGFQKAIGAMQPCILFLFEKATVDTETKYAFAAIGVFLMGFANEMLRYGRDRMAKSAEPSVSADFQRTVAFAVQIFLAYMLMLLVMLYEYVILIMLILGLSLGHLVSLRLSAPRRRAALQNGSKTPPETVGGSGTPCCNTDTVA